jgi:flagellar assembly protein FliH
VEKNLSNKVISGSEKEEVQQWTPPTVANSVSSGSMLTAEQLEQVQKQAFDEGFEQGKKNGFEYGHKEALLNGKRTLEETVERIDGLMQTLQTPFKQLDDQVEREIVELIIATVRQLARREIKADPEQIIGVVREALAILPVSSRNVQLILHPDDAELIREVYAITEKEVGWTIVEDPVLERGGCKVSTDISRVDATLESRLATLVTQLLGGERNQDAIRDEDD